MAERFPERLARMRRRRGISQTVLGELCGSCKNMIWKYENGKAIPSSDMICRLADELDVSVDYLLCRTNTQKIPK